MLLAAVCLLAFAPAYRAGTTNWDDDVYLASPGVTHISAATFTSFVLGNYHPLTLLSFAIDLQLFGRNAAELHAVNVVLHAITAILVFLLIQQLTALPFGSFAAALIWAIHPLRVESVVWIAERKDVLCTLFFTAALLAYVRRGIALTFVLFLLALLSKGMAVSLPLAMLAIDYLQRRKAIVEKLPFFAMSVVFGVVGLYAQRGPGANPNLPGFSFTIAQKFALAADAIVLYLGKLLVPVNLSAFYAYPKSLTWIDWLSLLFVAIVIAIVAWTAKATRTIAFAFLFFAVTIAVVLPVVSIGRTIAADRYTYIPSIGFAYLVALIARPRGWAIVAFIAAVFGVMTFQRSRAWHDSVTLWTSVIEADPEIALAHNSRGAALAVRGDFADAARDFDEAIALEPCYVTALRNRWLVAQKTGDASAAAAARDKLSRCQK